MRRWLALFVIGGAGCLAGCGMPLDAAAQRQFQQAQDAFDHARTPAEFLHVAARYQQLVDRGVRSGAVFYNQGNAYMRAGQRGRAIASYRQAQRYLPNHPHLDANLRFAIEPLAVVASRRPLAEYLLFWQDWIGYPGKLRLSLACAGITLLAGVAAVVRASSACRRTAFASLLVTLAACASAAYDGYRYEYLEHGVIVRKLVLPRKGNADSYEAAFTAPLAEGTEFLVRERRGTWIRIQLAGGEEGWVRADDAVTY